MAGISTYRTVRESLDPGYDSSVAESEGVYTQNSLHPVNLQDLYGDDGRYRIIHKLGDGSNATVWLCRDMWGEETRYNAVKISTACSLGEDCPATRAGGWDSLQGKAGRMRDWADTVCLPVRRFNIEGPSGCRHCTVYPVFGPKVSLAYSPAASNADHLLRAQGICRDLVRGVASLHKNSLRHGSITPDNVFHQVELDGLPEEEMTMILGEPVTDAMFKRAYLKGDDNTTPSYRISPVKWDKVGRKYIANRTYLVNPGTSFHKKCPSDKEPAIPMRYRSPELLFGKKADFESDLWALGCTLFEIRTGRSLFRAQERDDEDVYLKDIVDLFGALPEPYWSEWEGRGHFFEVDEYDNIVHFAELIIDGERNPRSLLEALAPGPGGREEEVSRGLSVPVGEREVFADLLEGFFKYKYLPEGRAEAMKGVLHHPWFALHKGNMGQVAQGIV